MSMDHSPNHESLLEKSPQDIFVQVSSLFLTDCWRPYLAFTFLNAGLEWGKKKIRQLYSTGYEHLHQYNA